MSWLIITEAEFLWADVKLTLQARDNIMCFSTSVCTSFLSRDRCRHTFIFPFLGESLTLSYSWLFSCFISAPNLGSAIKHKQWAGSHNEGKVGWLNCCMGVLLHLPFALSCLLSIYFVHFLSLCLKSIGRLSAGQWTDISVVYRFQLAQETCLPKDIHLTHLWSWQTFSHLSSFSLDTLWSLRSLNNVKEMKTQSKRKSNYMLYQANPLNSHCSVKV